MSFWRYFFFIQIYFYVESLAKALCSENTKNWVKYLLLVVETVWDEHDDRNFNNKSFYINCVSEESGSVADFIVKSQTCNKFLLCTFVT